MTSKQEIVSKLDLEHPEYIDARGQHMLNSGWCLWSHAWDCHGWALEDYRKHATIYTVEQFWEVFNGLPSLNNRDMWFFMREGIPPRWEDPKNLQGGSFKFRVSGQDIDNTWLTLSLHLITETMCLSRHDANLISGISLSPKKNNFATLSVWNLDCTHTEHAIFPSNIEGIDFQMSRYEPHLERKLG
jgi:hypothetical protein